MSRESVVKHISGGDPVYAAILGRLTTVPDAFVDRFGPRGALALLCGEENLQEQLQGDSDVLRNLTLLGLTVEQAADFWRRSFRLVIWGALKQWDVTDKEAEAFFEGCLSLTHQDFVNIARTH